MSATNTVPVGPFQPLLEEAEYFNIVVDGETVVDIELLGHPRKAVLLSKSNADFPVQPLRVRRVS